MSAGRNRWHESCAGKTMQPISVTRIEFFGGPEDGRVLDADLFLQLAGGESADFDRIAMLARDSNKPGDVYRMIGTCGQ